MERIRKNWTKEEKKYLEEKWGIISIPSIAKSLGRSEYGIINKARRLGLGRFLWSDVYWTFNLLLKDLGIGSGAYKNVSWIEKRGFPVKSKKVGKNAFKVVYIDDFWKWADKNRHLIDWSRVKHGVLGKEPKWLTEMRKNCYENKRLIKKSKWTKLEDRELKRLVELHKYTYLELGKMLQRSVGAIQRRLLDLDIKARPVKPDNHIKYTSDEKEYIHNAILTGKTYEQMSREVSKSTKGIRGYIYRIYGSENLDKVRNKIEKQEK